jgi:hypothetical protein
VQLTHALCHILHLVSHWLVSDLPVNWRVAHAPSNAPTPSATTPGCCCCCCTAPLPPLAPAAAAAAAAAAVAELVLAPAAMLPPAIAPAAVPPPAAAAAEGMPMDDRGPLVVLGGAPPADVAPSDPSIKQLVVLILHSSRQRHGASFPSDWTTLSLSRVKQQASTPMLAGLFFLVSNVNRVILTKQQGHPH